MVVAEVEQEKKRKKERSKLPENRTTQREQQMKKKTESKLQTDHTYLSSMSGLNSEERKKIDVQNARNRKQTMQKRKKNRRKMHYFNFKKREHTPHVLVRACLRIADPFHHRPLHQTQTPATAAAAPHVMGQRQIFETQWK